MTYKTISSFVKEVKSHQDEIHNPGVEGSSPSFTTTYDAPLERLGRFLFGHATYSVPILRPTYFYTL